MLKRCALGVGALQGAPLPSFRPYCIAASLGRTAAAVLVFLAVRIGNLRLGLILVVRLRMQLRMGMVLRLILIL